MRNNGAGLGTSLSGLEKASERVPSPEERFFMYNTPPMKRLALVMLIISALIAPACAEEELLDRVVAVVNDEVITQAELDVFLRPLYDEYSQQYSGEELIRLIQEARSKLLNQLIEDRLAYQEAAKLGLEVKEEDVDMEVEAFKTRIEEPVDMDTMLEKEGMSMKAFREKLKKQIMIRKLQEQEVRSKVVVSPLEIEKFYNENPDKFKSKERVRVKSLTIKKNPEARQKGLADEKARKAMDRLEGKIKTGGDFDKLVLDFSQDSHARDKKPQEWIERGAMIESVDEAVFNTPAGKLTGIVETPIGYHIFRIEEKEAAKTHAFAEVRDQIAGYLFQVKSDERFKEWMQGLKRGAYISIR